MPNGYIKSKNGTPVELVDAAARSNISDMEQRWLMQYSALTQSIDDITPVFVQYGSDTSAEFLVQLATGGKIIGVADMETLQFAFMERIDESFNLVFSNSKTLFKISIATNEWTREEIPTVTDEHINALIDAKLAALDGSEVTY